MSNEKTSSGSSAANFVVGIVLMLGGTWLSVSVTKAMEQLKHGEAATGSFSGIASALLSLEKQGIALDFGKTIATIGVLLILFPIIKSFYVTPLETAINDRNQDLERMFKEAEDLRVEMQKMRTEYEARITATEAQARDQIQSQIREAQQLRQTLLSEATARADALVAQAEQEIAAERDKVVVQLRLQVTDIALSAAEHVIGASMDNATNRRLVDDFIAKVEVIR